MEQTTIRCVWGLLELARATEPGSGGLVEARGCLLAQHAHWQLEREEIRRFAAGSGQVTPVTGIASPYVVVC